MVTAPEDFILSMVALAAYALDAKTSEASSTNGADLEKSELLCVLFNIFNLYFSLLMNLIYSHISN